MDARARENELSWLELAAYVAAGLAVAPAYWAALCAAYYFFNGGV